MFAHIARRSLIAAGTVPVLVALLSGPAMAESEDVEAIAGQLKQYTARYNQGDAKAVSQLYSEDVVYYGPLGRVFEGRAAVEQHYQDNLDAGFSDMTVDVIDIQIVGDTAYEAARYTIAGPNGEPLAGYHLAILEKEQGGWMVERTLVNVVMPAPPK